MKLFSKKQSVKEIVSDMKVNIDNMSYHAYELQKGINHLQELIDERFKLYDEALSMMDKMDGEK
ncbi:hypothetical protein AN964_05980 [Heyndrickxia shackletonii]|uniref:Uncharacterized protein n=1 Tax=Heyndrickxia shackletonii TaxID=157838 RepID=A0A0Q3TGI6_9BACI|nr:hypothetical protein [Heyndrickxia shackletonii]KQL53102.1 hypothetical protein AN964_05980 [Heyndrickxia shackletonii]NEZ01874.1 hypothetical protein [Heyndrickxia shackletonii]